MTITSQATQVQIQNQLGLHARAAAKFVKISARFSSEIMVTMGDQSVNGKSIMGIMMLAARQGTWLVLSAEGDDAEEALSALTTLIENKFGETC